MQQILPWHILHLQLTVVPLQQLSQLQVLLHAAVLLRPAQEQ
jgi:hypothetical protein